MRGPDPQRSAWFRSRWVCLRVLGVVYLFAFLSLADQALGILGHDGLAPARLALQGHRAEHGWLAVLHAPSVFWIAHGDGVIQAVMWIGVAASGLLIVNIAPRANAVALWLLYLSVSSMRGPFSPIQFFGWPPDHLVLETGLLALFLAPAGWRPGLGEATPVPTWVRWLAYFLLFKLMFGSGMIKLLHGQDVWLDLTALYHDHETRPHPTTLAAYARDWPLWTLQACALFTLLVEVPVTLLYFVPGRSRRIAAVLTAALMVGIMLLGNYRWFPLTTLAITALLVDDAGWRVLVPAALRRSPARDPVAVIGERRIWSRVLTGTVFVLVLLFGSIQLVDICNGRNEPVGWLRGLRESLAPFHLSHGYAMFPHIHKERRVIQFEASDDGVHWQALENLSNPGRLDRPCAYFAPYHHYLDFLMWMSAHVEWTANPRWVGHLAHGLLVGYAPTYRLFERVPFDPAAPPRFVRGELYLYRYANPEQRAAGQWWTRTRLGPWLPAATLDQAGNLAPAAVDEPEPAPRTGGSRR